MNIISITFAYVPFPDGEQYWLIHCSVSVVLPVQFSPPFDGGGESHDLVFTKVPYPQSALHGVDDHAPHSPSTI